MTLPFGVSRNSGVLPLSVRTTRASPAARGGPAGSPTSTTAFPVVSIIRIQAILAALSCRISSSTATASLDAVLERTSTLWQLHFMRSGSISCICGRCRRGRGRYARLRDAP